MSFARVANKSRHLGDDEGTSRDFVLNPLGRTSNNSEFDHGDA